MRLLPALYILNVSTFLVFPLLAEAKKPSAYNHSIGITHNFSKQDLSIYIDQNKILKNIPRLQKAGLVDTNLSNTEISFYEMQLSVMVSIPYTTKVIQGLYSSNPKNDPIHVTSYLITTDLYGNKAKTLCYSFNFNRQLYQKINWKKFQTTNIVKIAPDFKTSNVCKVLEETSPLSI